MRTSESVKNAYEKLEVKKSKGGAFKAPKKEFVCLEDWDDSDGKYTDDQIVERRRCLG